MFGVLLTSISTFFQEISASIGKDGVARKMQSVYTMGFLNSFWTILIFVFLIAVAGQKFVFSFASLPTVGLRMFFELLQADFSVRAVVVADRSTYSFIRILTIPLLLSIDLFLGYKISSSQLAGIFLIALTFAFVFVARDIKKAGVKLVLFTTANAAITISLFKYNITHFNSVAAEQVIFYFVILMYFFLSARFRSGENPFSFLRKPRFFLQSSANGVGGILQSFAYLFAPASVIVAAERSTAVLWSVLSGNIYFREKNFWLKVALMGGIIVGIILLAR